MIEGAHEGKGLGIQFLRHIERTKVLVFLLDGTGEDIKADFKVLQKELKLFNKDLPKKPTVITITKIDAVDAKKMSESRKVQFKGIPTFFISAVARIGIRELIEEMWKHISPYKAEKPTPVDERVDVQARRTERKKKIRRPTRNRRREWE